MPGAGDALAWDRYAYVNYNPLKYVDPSGHTGFVPRKNVLLSDTGNWKGFPGDQWFIDVRPLAISVEVSGSAGIGFGGSGGMGIVIVDRPYVYTTIGETSEVPGEATLGVEIGVDWGINSVSDLEGFETVVGLTVAAGWGLSIGFIIEPGEGKYSTYEITGVSISLVKGLGLSLF